MLSEGFKDEVTTESGLSTSTVDPKDDAKSQALSALKALHEKPFSTLKPGSFKEMWILGPTPSSDKKSTITPAIVYRFADGSTADEQEEMTAFAKLNIASMSIEAEMLQLNFESQTGWGQKLTGKVQKSCEMRVEASKSRSWDWLHPWYRVDLTGEAISNLEEQTAIELVQLELGEMA